MEIIFKTVKENYFDICSLKESESVNGAQVLVGPPGVGRRALIQRIVAHNPKLFDTIKAGQYFILLAIKF